MNELFKLGRVTEETMGSVGGTWAEFFSGTSCTSHYDGTFDTSCK